MCVLFCYQQKKAAKDENNTFSDDEIPAGVNFQDPYFVEEVSKQGNEMKSMICFC